MNTDPSATWVVLKFGGTSVAGPEQWEAIARLAAARADTGRRVLLVCSALAGITDALQELVDSPAEPSDPILDILQRHEELARGLRVASQDLLDDARQFLHHEHEALHANHHPAHQAALLGIGERLSTRIGARFLGQRLDAEWVDARDALEVLPEPEGAESRAWLSARCAAGPSPALQAQWSARSPVLVTEGFVARSADGRTALLGRGGSDTSAALLAGRLQAGAIEIWTDVAGLFSADPRREPAARLLPALGYAEALELAASGARVVHPRCIRAAAEVGIPIEIHDLARPDATGTRIGAGIPPGPEGIKAVTRQDGVLVMLLENSDTRQQVGFLARVFEIVSRRGVSVDLVATSETTTTIAIDKAANHLAAGAAERLAEALEEVCRVRWFDDCSCVNLVGRGARMALARLGPAVASFEDWPLFMLSQSANDLSISLLVSAEHAPELCARLHATLIAAGGEGPPA